MSTVSVALAPTKTANPKEETGTRMLRLLLNGREVWLAENEVIRLAQISAAAHEKFREASDMRKQAEQVFQELLELRKFKSTHST